MFSRGYRKRTVVLNGLMAQKLHPNTILILTRSLTHPTTHSPPHLTSLSAQFWDLQQI